MNPLAYVFSTAGTVCACAPSLLKGKNMKLILLLVFLANTFIALSYVLTGAFSGAVSCGVGALQTIINYFYERKNKPIPVWLIGVYARAFTVVNLLAFSRITDILALLACLTFVMCIGQKNGRKYRIWTVANSGLWALYDLTSLSFGPLFTHLLQLAIALFGMVIHDRKKPQ